MDHMIGNRPIQVVAKVMNSDGCAWRRLRQWRRADLRGCAAGLRLRLFIRKIEVEEHEDTGFGIDTQQRDQAHPYRDTHVVWSR